MTDVLLVDRTDGMATITLNRPESMNSLSVELKQALLETLLDMARSGAHPIGPAEIDVVLKAVDVLTVMINDLPARAAGQAAADVSARCDEVLAVTDRLIAVATTPAAVC